MKRQKSDLDQLLREYFHEETREMSLDPAVLDRALGRALGPDRIHVETRWQRPWRRALSGLAGLAALVAVGLLLMPRHSTPLLPSHSSSLAAAHPVSSAGSILPAGRVVALAASSPVTLWSLTYHQGVWQLWRGNPAGQSWQKTVEIPGNRREAPQLVFSGTGQGWLAVDQKAGWALFQKGHGGAWSALAVPGHPRELNLAVKNGHLLAALSSRSSHAATQLFLLGGRDHWRKVPSQGLPGGVSSLWFASSQQGFAQAAVGRYITGNGGRTWTNVLNLQVAAPVTSATSASVPAVDVPTAGLDHHLAILGSKEWAVWDGALWSRANLSPKTTWRRVATLPFLQPVRSLVLQEGGQGWILTGGGHLWTTRDGGHHWSLLK